MRGNNRYQKSEWIRKCPVCQKCVYHKNEASLKTGMWKNCPCWECRSEFHSKKMKGRKREPFSNEWKQNLAIGHKKSEKWKKSMNTPEYKEKHRQKMQKIINEGKLSVCYNKNACLVFNQINNKFGWNGFHALNGKEKIINGFYLDYYEPTLNLVIEWDEKHHKKSKIKQKDAFRQKIIIEKIDCEFYRIDDTNKTIKKVDKNKVDRTSQIQNIINDYYENRK